MSWTVSANRWNSSRGKDCPRNEAAVGVRRYS